MTSYCKSWVLHCDHPDIVSLFFFFSSRRRHTRCLSDWSSDVCSSDLQPSQRRLIATVKGYVTLGGAGQKTGRLDVKTRELIALAVAISLRCDGCITVHTEAARKTGRTEERRVGEEGRSRWSPDPLKKK